MRIGFFSLPLPGHLYPITTLARRLQSFGHEVFFFGLPDSERFIHSAELHFIAYGEQEYPVGSMAEVWEPIARLQGLDILKYTAQTILPKLLATAFQHLPAAVSKSQLDGIVVDRGYAFVELVPMALAIPYVHVWAPLHRDPTGGTPPTMFSWTNEATPEALMRNKEAAKQIGSYFASLFPTAMAYAETANLTVDLKIPGSTESKLAIISQTPREFDFPGIQWPPQFHYAGPFHDDEGREPVPFPWEKLDGRPLIYASLGTLSNGLTWVYQAILGAAGALPEVQVVFSIGTNVSAEALGPVPSNTILVPKAPQLELLKRAALCITHAGLNTVLEALAQGIPLVAIPIGYDQPGVAARIAFQGVGEFVELGDLTVDHLHRHIRSVLDVPAYRERALYFQQVIANTHGLDLAAETVEQAFTV